MLMQFQQVATYFQNIFYTWMVIQVISVIDLITNIIRVS